MESCWNAFCSASGLVFYLPFLTWFEMYIWVWRSLPMPRRLRSTSVLYFFSRVAISAKFTPKHITYFKFVKHSLQSKHCNIFLLRLNQPIACSGTPQGQALNNVRCLLIVNLYLALLYNAGSKTRMVYNFPSIASLISHNTLIPIVQGRLLFIQER